MARLTVFKTFALNDREEWAWMITRPRRYQVRSTSGYKSADGARRAGRAAARELGIAIKKPRRTRK